MKNLLCLIVLAIAHHTVLQSTVYAFQNDDSTSARQDFLIDGHKAFILPPPQSSRADEPIPWVWYAPTLGPYPGKHEEWMFQRFHAEGIAIAGIDVGESYGSPTGTAIYQKLYVELTDNRGYSTKPVLLARSRGGLMLYNWAIDHADSVGGIAGIYPVCNIASYPGIDRASGAYEMTSKELEAKLSDYNPIDRLESLAKAKVPVFHIHGDSDTVVPLESNSEILAERYQAMDGPIELEVVEGQGHNVWSGWFESEKLTDFVIDLATSEGNNN